ncbi:MAG: VCBS repeat-containing protein, partial [Candidatus Coatesbacteria bacterium]
MRYLKTLVITTFCIVLTSGAYATTHEATQTDWSGGPDVPGPVTDWDDTFDTSTDVSWLDFPGELHLSSSPKTSVEHTVDGSFDGAISVHAADIDGDGDMDVLGAGRYAHDITWWSNDDGFGTSWTEHRIVDYFDGAHSVYAADVDDDGDKDVLGAAPYDNEIALWSNGDGIGTFWTYCQIDGDFDQAVSVYAADIDDDGDIDVLGAAYVADDIAWWSNDDGTGTSWTKHAVDEDFDEAISVCAADVDGDGDMDVLGAAHDDDDITWWSNDDGSGTSWTEHTVDGEFDGAFSVYAADVDGDGDADVLGAARY